MQLIKEGVLVYTWYEILGISEDANAKEINIAYLNFLVKCNNYLIRNISISQKRLINSLILIIINGYEKAIQKARYNTVNNIVRKNFTKLNKEDKERESEELRFKEEQRKQQKALEDMLKIEVERANEVYNEKLRNAKIEKIKKIIGSKDFSISEDKLIELYDLSVTIANLIQMEMLNKSLCMKSDDSQQWVSSGKFVFIGKQYPLEKNNHNKCTF